jgi:hypothetical protein
MRQFTQARQFVRTIALLRHVPLPFETGSALPHLRWSWAVVRVAAYQHLIP